MTNPHPVTGLNAATSYEFYVRADCGGGDISNWTGPFAFSTACAAYATPFTEDFESGSPSIGCWTQSYEAGASSWVISEGATVGAITTAYSGTQNMRFVSENSTGAPITKLISPMLDISALANPELSFYYAQEGWQGDQNELKVYYRESEIDPWFEIAHYTNNIDTWTQEVLSLPNPTATYQIAFEGINNFGFPNVLDDVVVQEGLSVVSSEFGNFTYYPNPVKNSLFIESGKGIENVNIYTFTGKKIISKNNVGKSLSLDMSALQPGIYFMETQINGTVETLKIVKR